MQQVMSQIRMKRPVVLVSAVLVTAALFGGVVHLVLVAANVSEPAANTVYGATPQRLWATVAAGLGLGSVVIGGLVLIRPAIRFGIISGRIGAVAALAVGVIALVNGWLLLAAATGGPGTGNGVVGAAGALVLGLIGAVIGGLTLTRDLRGAR